MRRYSLVRGCRINSYSTASHVRSNEIGIQLLTPTLSRQVFPETCSQSPSPAYTQLSKIILNQWGLYGKNLPSHDDVPIELPPLLGKDIQSHFWNMGEMQSREYMDLALTLLSSPCPPMPHRSLWSRQPGWTRYHADGTRESVDYPPEQILVFDVEVLMTHSDYPIMAVAASPTHWYGWVSPVVMDPASQPCLVHLGHSGRRIVVGHHVGFDRSKVAQEYQMDAAETGWLDTMSLHLSVGGLTNQQRPLWKKYQKAKQDHVKEANLFTKAQLKNASFSWCEQVSTNGLREVAQLYLNKELDKTTRNIFVTGSLHDVQEYFQELMEYAANDVFITYELFQSVFPQYYKKCPHPVSFVGILEMGRGYLPVTRKWQQFIQSAEEKMEECNQKIESNMQVAVQEALTYQQDERWKSDPWLKHLDWQVPSSQTKGLSKTPEEIEALDEEKQKRYAKRLRKATLLKDKPMWYRDLWDPKEQRIKLTSRQRMAPYVLKLTWLGYPIYYSKVYGWTFYAPASCTLKYEKLPREPPESHDFDPVIYHDTESEYYRIPHPDGEANNTGNPLAKSFLTHFENGILKSQVSAAVEILKLTSQCSYWLGCRQRVTSQMVGWSSQVDLGRIRSDPKETENEVGVILPRTVVMGTVTRRAVEPLWMTAANAKEKAIGSELKSRIQAPPGFCFVGADVDSQELWIAALLGDAQLGIHGGTPFGFMTLQGTKANKTDMHSVTASILGISRDNAKVFNYARIYGAGVGFAKKLLLQFDPDMSEKDAKKKASDLYAQTKGTRVRSSGSTPHYWKGGSESCTFNALESISNQNAPKTPTLQCEIPNGLLRQNLGSETEFLTSRINWIVQSSGVDYLHMLLTCMKYLQSYYGIDMRFSISIHDEVRFLVKEQDKYKAALALQIANIWTRTMFAHCVGMTNLPMSVAFFSSVDIDHCLRKEVFMKCVTPSNPVPVDPGEALDMYELLSKTSIEPVAKQGLPSLSLPPFTSKGHLVPIQDLIRIYPHAESELLQGGVVLAKKTRTTFVKRKLTR